MNSATLAGIFRAVLAAVGGYLAGKGIDLGIDWAEVAGALAVVVTAVWSVFAKKGPAPKPAE